MARNRKNRRPCWWCGGALTFVMETSHYNAASLKDQLGNNILVHHICREDTEKMIKQVTAHHGRDEYGTSIIKREDSE